ncbi:MAG: hypothetical protein M3Q56_00505 [Bacteroidota bacterium]|nr:hypothetical protein [Bacteroidota bacterium]
MIKLRYALFPILLVFFLPSCDLLDDSPCGPKTTADLYLLGSNMLDKAYLHTYTEGNNRVFQWSELVEEVCTDEHIKSEFRLALLDENSAKDLNIKARASISYQFLYEKNIELVQNGNDLKGSLEVGLKHAFSDLNGWFVHSLEVYFPTKGSLIEDEKFLFPREPVDSSLVGKLISIEIKTNHRHFK